MPQSLREETEGKLQMLLSSKKKKGLDSLFKEVRVFKGTELESGNALGAFLQTPAPALDKISGPMGARFWSSAGLQFATLIERERERAHKSSQHPHWIKIGLPNESHRNSFATLLFLGSAQRARFQRAPVD